MSVLLAPKSAPAQPRNRDTIIPGTHSDAVVASSPTALMVYAAGGADVDAACKKPVFFDKQRNQEATSSSVLTTSWSDQCADKGAEAGGGLLGVAGFTNLQVLATASYTTNKDRGAAINTTVMAMYSDLLTFQLVDAATNPLRKSSCGISIGAVPVDILSVKVRVTTVATLPPASYDLAGGTYSTFFSALGDPHLFGTDVSPPVLWNCLGFNSCRGGTYSDQRTVTVNIGNWPAGAHAGQPIAIPLTVRAGASIILGAIARESTDDLVAGVYNVKVCVDPIGAVRVTSASGTDYSNAANHCY